MTAGVQGVHSRQYWHELWRERQPLGAAMLGTGFSVSLNMFIASVFMPAMIAEFGWASSDVSFVGTLGLIGMLTFPLAGRLADMFGSRRVMMAGIVALPSIFFLYSLQTGPIWQFWAIQAAWALLSPLWSATVLGRIAAGRLTLARGFGIARTAHASTDFHQMEEDEFATAAIKKLNTMAQRSSLDFVIVPTPRVLGVMRKHYGVALRKCLRAEIAKDYAGRSIADIADCFVTMRRDADNGRLQIFGDP
jgi:hypothetical protein